jgi:hypothetical protein
MNAIPLLIVGALSVILSACASVQTLRTDEVATTQEPFDAVLGFNTVHVAQGAPLSVSMVDDKRALCTRTAAYHSLGASRGVCFFDTKSSGILDSYYILGTLRSLTYAAHVPYSITSHYIPTAIKRADNIDRAQCAYESGVSEDGSVGTELMAALVTPLIITVARDQAMKSCLAAHTAMRQ